MYFQKRPCSRCPRVDEVPITLEELQDGGPPKTPPEVVIRFGAHEKTLENLCGECKVIVATHLTIVLKRLEKNSSRRKVKSKGGDMIEVDTD